jgi:hypothetical protein
VQVSDKEFGIGVVGSGYMGRIHAEEATVV